MNINVGKQFYHRLVNRNARQGDGKHTGEEFRNQFLSICDDKRYWESPHITPIILDFSDVKVLAPSWANEVFAYFAKFADPAEILKRIVLVNITPVKLQIIKDELSSGWSQDRNFHAPN